jgi:small redox-active disulfide protein 2
MKTETMKFKIKIFGVGSYSDKTLLESVQMAASELGVLIEVEQVKDIGMFVKKGISAIPALSIDEEIVSYGRVPSISEIKSFLQVRARA